MYLFKIIPPPESTFKLIKLEGLKQLKYFSG
jgi:hypothetical protein